MTPEDLLKGAFYALEQCGLLLRDANILYRNRSYANTIVLAAFAHEELGRHRILLDLWRVAHGGKETVTTKQIKRACKEHETKQERGMSGTTLKSGIKGLLEAIAKSDPPSPEYDALDAELRKIIKAKQKRTPNDRHDMRIAALYVEPVSETRWNRPADTSAIVALEFLREAVNDYSRQCHKGFISPRDAILERTDPELYSALEQWSDRPKLQAPEWPPELEQVDVIPATSELTPAS
jgi:AbiV family abortive infection protein